MKKSIKITAFILALLMLMSSCSDKTADNEEETSPETETTAETSEPVETEPEVETASSKIEKKFANTSYGGKTFTILGNEAGQRYYYTCISPTFNEIWADGYNGEIINDAIFDRNSKAEALLDMKFEHLYNSDIPNMLKLYLRLS